jgi:hypothetical protein
VHWEQGDTLVTRIDFLSIQTLLNLEFHLPWYYRLSSFVVINAIFRWWSPDHQTRIGMKPAMHPA